MDAIDKNIIARLQCNARESLSSLARELGISRSTLKDRLDRLEDRGIIEGYTLRLNRDYQKRRIRAQVMLNIEPSRYAQIVGELESFAGIRALHAVSGDYDLMALLETDSTEELDALVDQIGTVAGVKKTNSFILFSTKFER